MTIVAKIQHLYDSSTTNPQKDYRINKNLHIVQIIHNSKQNKCTFWKDDNTMSLYVQQSNVNIFIAWGQKFQLLKLNFS